MSPGSGQASSTKAAGLAARGANAAGMGRQAAKVLARAGLVEPHRPDRLARALGGLVRFGPTAAGGYEAAAALAPDDVAIADERGELTFGEMHERTGRLARALLARGVGEGDRVAVMTRNHRGFVDVVVALSRLGADALLLNTGSSARQLEEVLDREEASMVVHDEEFGELLAGALAAREGIVAWVDSDGVTGPTLDGLIAAGGAPPLPRRPGREGRITILTSGTTGTPKGANRGSPGIGAAVAILSSIPLKAGEPTLISAPLFHQWGYAHLMLHLLLRTKLVLRRRFQPADVLRVIAEQRVRTAALVPVMCQRILELDEAQLDAADASSLAVVAVSGSALSPDLAARFMDRFGDVLYNLYGSTEVAWAAIASPADLRAAPGTVGRPPYGTTLRIYAEGRDERLPAGETGRILVGNDMLFEGYTGGGGKDVVDGLMATGDVGHFDADGRLFVDGRDDDMIVSGGENVFPQEVEEHLAEHPAVRDVAVVGVEDEQFGQRLAAFVVVSEEVDADALKQHVKDGLAGYKVPRDVRFVDELPRSEQGKVLKRELVASEQDASAAT